MPFFTSFSGKILSAPGLKLGPNLFQFAKTLSSSVQAYSLSSDLVANGWDEVTPVQAIITINSGVYVWSDNISVPAFNTGYIAPGSTISIVNNGYIIGRGGNGQTPTQQPQAGGPAINLNYSVSITNNSYIAGGGGGGGGNSTFLGGGGGGAGGGAGGVIQQLNGGSVPAGGLPGGIGASGGAGTQSRVGPTPPGPAGVTFIKVGSGGGGGRILPGTGGAGGSNSSSAAVDNSGGGGQSGGGGGGLYRDQGGVVTFARGGTGGFAGLTGGDGPTEVGATGCGGGGGWGASGGAGNVAGALGGKCINLNGNTVTWVSSGGRYGAIS